MKKPRKQTEVVIGSGNTFSDIGLPGAQTHLAKADICRLICSIIKKRKLSQSDAAALLGIDQPKISKLMRGNLSGFSTERLLKYVLALGRNVNIRIGKNYSSRPHITVG